MPDRDHFGMTRPGASRGRAGAGAAAVRPHRGPPAGDAGRATVPADRADLNARCDAARKAAAPAGGGMGKIAPAAPVTTTTDMMAPFIAQMRADAAQLSVEEVPPSDAYAAPRRGRTWRSPPRRRRSSRRVARGSPGCRCRRTRRPGTHGRGTTGCGSSNRRRSHHAVQRVGVHCTAACEDVDPAIAQTLAAAGHGVAVASGDQRYGLRPLPGAPTTTARRGSRCTPGGTRATTRRRRSSRWCTGWGRTSCSATGPARPPCRTPGKDGGACDGGGRAGGSAGTRAGAQPVLSWCSATRRR
jgi:hypothetical protein